MNKDNKEIKNWASDFRLKPEVKQAGYKGRVLIEQEVLDKLQCYVGLTDKEISGLGMASIKGDDVYINDCYLLKQTNSSATTELDTDDIARLQFELHQQGKDISQLKFWWHSHASMGVAWSHRDYQTMEEFDNGKWLISIVVNHSGDCRACLTVYKPFKVQFDQLPVIVVDKVKEDRLNKLREELQVEYDFLVTERTWQTNNVTYNYGSQWETCPKCRRLLEYCSCYPLLNKGEVQDKKPEVKKVTYKEELPQTLEEFREYVKEQSLGFSHNDSLDWALDDYYSAFADECIDDVERFGCTEEGLFQGYFQDCFGIWWLTSKDKELNEEAYPIEDIEEVEEIKRLTKQDWELLAKAELDDLNMRTEDSN